MVPQNFILKGSEGKAFVRSRFMRKSVWWARGKFNECKPCPNPNSTFLQILKGAEISLFLDADTIPTKEADKIPNLTIELFSLASEDWEPDGGLGSLLQ